MFGTLIMLPLLEFPPPPRTLSWAWTVIIAHKQAGVARGYDFAWEKGEKVQPSAT